MMSFDVLMGMTRKLCQVRTRAKQAKKTVIMGTKRMKREEKARLYLRQIEVFRIEKRKDRYRLKKQEWMHPPLMMVQMKVFQKL